MRRGCRAVLLAFLCFLLPYRVLQAQTPDPIPAAITPQNNTGDLPYSTSVGSATEHVELASGNLIVTIPFVDVPGRKMSFDYGIRYDARFWVEKNRSSILYWQPDQRGWLVPNVIGWTGTQAYMTYVEGPSYCVGIDDIVPGQINPKIYTSGGTREDNFVFTDRQGVKHNFLVNKFVSGECDRGLPVGSFISTNFEGPSPDMDGYYATMSSNMPSISGPDGTHYGASSSTVVSGGANDILDRSFYVDRTAETDSYGNTQSVAAGNQDSIGRTPVIMQVNGNQIIYTVTDSSGNPQTYTVNLVSKAISTQFNINSISTEKDYNTDGTLTSELVDSVILPNGLSYHFQYDSWAEITEITLPSSAVIDYQWTTINVSGVVARAISQRSVTHDGHTDTWKFKYAYTETPSMENLGIVTVTSPADASGQSYNTIYTYDGEQHLTRVQYLGNSNSSSQLVQYDMTWDTSRPDPSSDHMENSLMTSLTTTLENGLVSRKTFEYDLYAFPYQPFNCGDAGAGFLECLDIAADGATISGVQFVPSPPTYLPPPTPQPGSHGNVTSIKEYDWGQGAPGSLVRQTIRSYLHDQDQAYFVAGSPATPGLSGRGIRNITNRVVDQTIYDGSVVCSGTGTWSYDGVGTITPPAACTANKLAETKVVYDNGSGTTDGYLGEATSISQWAGGTTYLTTSYTYDQYGNVISEIDPKGYRTNYGYLDAWTGSSACNVSANSNAYLTSITNPLQQKSTQTFYECTGKVASQTDANNNTVSLTYDWLGRPLYVNLPDGGQTSTTYDDTKLTTTVDQLISAGQIHELITQLDQLGRATQTRLTSDPQGTVYTDTTYDALGRVNTVSNPYRSTADQTYGITQTFYDARNRKVQQVNPDSTTLGWSYTGNVATSADENGNKWARITDALGRLVQVDEGGEGSTGTFGAPATGSTATFTVIGSVESAPDPNSPPKPGSGVVSLAGSERTAQVQTQIAANGTGTVDVRDGEQSINSPDEPCPPLPQKCPQIYDRGNVFLTVNGVTESSSYSQGTTALALATALANAFNNDSASPVTATTATVASSFATITLVAKTAGSGTNYSVSSGSVTNEPAFFSNPSFLNAPAALSGGQDNLYQTVYDTGTVSIAVGGVVESAAYGQGSTPAQIVSSLATALSQDASTQVSAVGSGNSVVITSTSAGASTNYSLSTSATTTYPAQFSGSSFTTSSGASLTNGQDQGSLYDQGTVAVTVGSFQAQASYSANASSWSVAASLAAALNASGSPVSATASSNTVTLSSTATGSATDYPLGSSATSNYPSSFSSPSFFVSAPGGMAGGSDGTSTQPGQPNLSTPLTTLYTYDALGNLTCVEQHGGVSGTGCTSLQSSDASSPWRVRRFSYDSLSRLITSQNPETGTIGYSYDANSNLHSKTDARGITTNYTYDALNRLLSKTYMSDATGTASSCYQYDGASTANSIGRLTNQWTQAPSLGACVATPPLTGYLTLRSILAYDSMGRIQSEQQCTKSNCVTGTPYNAVYSYDLAGNIFTHSNGLGTMTFSNCYDAANRLLLVVSASTPCSAAPSPSTTLFAAPSYSPAGGLTAATFGASLQLSRSYDSRLRVTGETDIGNATTSTAGSATLTITGTEQMQP